MSPCRQQECACQRGVSPIPPAELLFCFFCFHPPPSATAGGGQRLCGRGPLPGGIQERHIWRCAGEGDKGGGQARRVPPPSLLSCARVCALACRAAPGGAASTRGDRRVGGASRFRFVVVRAPPPVASDSRKGWARRGGARGGRAPPRVGWRRGRVLCGTPPSRPPPPWRPVSPLSAPTATAVEGVGRGPLPTGGSDATSLSLLPPSRVRPPCPPLAATARPPRGLSVCRRATLSVAAADAYTLCSRAHALFS